MAKDKICTPFLALASPENKFTVNTIEDMQSRKYLKIGDIVELNGYYTAGDGAGHKRKIEAADDGSGVQLANGLWGNIVHSGEVNVSWFGAKGDGVTDDSVVIQKAITFVESFITSDPYQEENGGSLSATLKFGRGIFLVSKLVFSESGLKFWGAGKDNTLIKSSLLFLDTKDFINNIIENSVFTSSRASYKNRIEIKNLSIKSNKSINHINLISVGQSKVTDVCLYGGLRGFGYGIVCASIKRDDGIQVAGHLNTIERVKFFDMNYGVYMFGGTNANKIYNIEVLRSKYGIYIDNFKIDGLSGGSNTVSNGCRFETCDNGIFTNGNFNRISDVYLDGLINGIVLGQENAYSEIYGIHYSPSVTNPIIDLNTEINNRKRTVTGHYRGTLYGEKIELSNGTAVQGVRGTDFLSISKRVNLLGGYLSEGVSYVDMLRFEPGKDVGSNRLILYLNESNDLAYIDKNGYKKTISLSSSGTQQLNTPYHATKMQQEGVYEDFIQYMDSKTEYDRLQRETEQQRQLAFEQSGMENYEEWLAKQPMMLPVENEPQPSEALLKFKEKYLG